MNEGPSPPATDEGREGGSGDAGADQSSGDGGSFLARLLRRASSALNGDDEAEAELTAELARELRHATPAERAMVANILRLHEQRVSDVMTPRADIVGVAEDASLEEVMAAFARGEFSRLPVHRETLDDPLGFVHLKDIALAYGVGVPKEVPEFSLSRHIRKALFVPPSMRIAALMQRMQAARVHMALVIDEFGGVDGLVTIEDLVEQIVGDIEDEHDDEEIDEWTEEADGVYLIDARADIREFETSEGVELLPADWEEEIDSFGGLVFMLTGRVPARGEVIAHPGGHEFEIIDADPRRVKRLRLTLRGHGNGTGPEARQAAE
ncbi:MAG TPA: hemolysin family protein [Thermohalobaculum sp.]|nr:hemolysin family protein [Thermohalobaculum sp.]